MKIHYINILLFVIPLNILINDQRNHKSTTPHTPKIPTTRLLCECDIYTSIYDNDPQMKEVMQQFEDRTSQRFHEYDERMKTTRQKCKDKCDKEIQKIILKDKMEKQMAQQLTTLETKIDTNDIPTCICEKSMVDKMEKGCLRCGGVLGGGVTPAWGLISGIVYTGWKAAALAAAKSSAIAEGAMAGKAAGIEAGIEAVISGIKSKFPIHTLNVEALESVIAQKYNDVSLISGFIHSEFSRLECGNISSSSFLKNPFCYFVNEGIGTTWVGEGGSPEKFIETIVEEVVEAADGVADTEAARVTAAKTAEFKETYMAAVNTTYGGYHTIIISSVVAIVVIVLIMVIIYLILRYRRKKKMKKKLQYIKLLEE
ncbi:hypothetical protein PFBG_00153 [Plasmodium falciparum 7G8]|uniref:Rifin n=1 Tax=Plasmodium falciparum (isolate 7G8) TaxID=57266 RepID=W7F8D6_PLAF8|nr:hypothetical protein PFBG_00153 [Plasmodium falciparum 7G8]